MRLLPILHNMHNAKSSCLALVYSIGMGMRFSYDDRQNSSIHYTNRHLFRLEVELILPVTQWPDSDREH